ncbi:MAG: anti-sigma factor domain-containing protein, partial [Frankia sp.]
RAASSCRWRSTAPERASRVRARGGRVSRAAPRAVSRRRHRGSNSVRMLVAVVVVIAALGLVGGLAAWGAVESGRAADRQTALQQRDALLAGLVSSDARTVALLGTQGAGAAIVINGSRVRVVTSGLTANDPTRDTYVLWAINAAGPLTGVRAFDVGSRAVTLVNVGTVAPAVSGAKGFAISLEPGRTMPTAPSRLLLV